MNKDDDLAKLALLLLAFFLPPLAVALRGGITAHLAISCVLTMFMIIPGIIHAAWYVLRENPSA